MKRKFIQILSTVAAVITVSACNLDINKDPYAVTTLDFAQVLTAAEYEVGINFAEGHYLNSNFSAYVHQTVSREIDNYSLVANYSGAEIGLVGRNLFFWAPNVPKYSNYDPIVNSYGETNVQGIDYTSAPSVRRFAVNLKLTF